VRAKIRMAPLQATARPLDRQRSLHAISINPRDRNS